MPPPARRTHRIATRVYSRLTLWRAMAVVACVVTSITVSAALLERLVEPETFDSYGEALWWSVSTVSTTGYGDITPVTVPGRVIASVVMMVSLAVVPVVTSIVITALIRRDQERREEP